jgi:hypothetical protein
MHHRETLPVISMTDPLEWQNNYRQLDSGSPGLTAMALQWLIITPDLHAGSLAASVRGSLSQIQAAFGANKC